MNVYEVKLKDGSTEKVVKVIARTASSAIDLAGRYAKKHWYGNMEVVRVEKILHADVFYKSAL